MRDWLNIKFTKLSFMILFWERPVKETLKFCFERDDYYVLKREIISLIYKYVTHFTTIGNMNHDEIIAPYTTIDYKNSGDIQG